MAKASRQYLIARLLQSHAVANQLQLLDLLRSHGIRSTRATVSRDLDELGAVKMRAPSGPSVYAIPERSWMNVDPDEHLSRLLSDWVISISSSASLVVVRTLPGSAHVVAAALDRAGLKESLGTVAGNDTVIAVAVEGSHMKLVKRLSKLAGLDASNTLNTPETFDTPNTSNTPNTLNTSNTSNTLNTSNMQADTNMKIDTSDVKADE